MATSYAKGFDSLEKEIKIDDPLIEGKIPKWLNGSLLRTVPSLFEAPNKPLNHWFDGYAMLHQFNFLNGAVSYQNKFVHSESYTSMREKGKMTRSEFATDPCRSIFGYLFSLFKPPPPTDNPNVNVNKIGDEFVAMTETPMPIKFNMDDLASKGYFEFEDDLEGILSVAHPHFDEQGNMYSYLLDFGYKSKYLIYKLAKGSKKRELIAEIPSKKPAYVHSIGYTENYLILIEAPFVVNPLKLRFTWKPLITNYKWKPELGTRFHIIDKKGKKLLKTIKSSAFFSFHHINAYEENGAILLDLIAYPDASVLDDLYLEKLRKEAPNPTGKLWRYRLNAESGMAKGECLSDTFMELPRINYAFNGNAYQYLYAASNKIEGNFFDALLKRNMKSGTEYWWVEEKAYPGEAVFVPHPEAKQEDDGVVMSVVLNAKNEKSFLLVLDAATFKEIARVKLPQHIPFGFHGNYFQ